jgi:hypothetical protein
MGASNLNGCKNTGFYGIERKSPTLLGSRALNYSLMLFRVCEKVSPEMRMK